MRVELPRRLLMPVSSLIFVTLCVVVIHCNRATAQTPAFTGPQTKLVFYAEHRIDDGEWSALFTALRRGLTAGDEGQPLVEDVVLVRGDEHAEGVGAQEGISVYLEGSCKLMPPLFNAPHAVEGKLGWVPSVRGRIQPFIHVNCTMLTQMLNNAAMHLNREGKDSAMAEAIARVIEHEWIHYATQNAGHSGHGVSRPAFTLMDLLAEERESGPAKATSDKARNEVTNGPANGKSESRNIFSEDCKAGN